MDSYSKKILHEKMNPLIMIMYPHSFVVHQKSDYDLLRTTPFRDINKQFFR